MDAAAVPSVPSWFERPRSLDLEARCAGGNGGGDASLVAAAQRYCDSGEGSAPAAVASAAPKASARLAARVWPIAVANAARAQALSALDDAELEGLVLRATLGGSVASRAAACAWAAP